MSETSKVCLNHCPNCNAGVDDINWGSFITGDVVYQEGECEICGCCFKEYYEYSDTEFVLEEVPRVRCEYPLSKFYNYMDEVPIEAKVSTPEDCEKCDGKVGDNDEECTEKHCLIIDEIKFTEEEMEKKDADIHEN